MNQKETRCEDDSLRHELAQGDAMLETLVPILHHLLANDAHALFSEETIARVRGMIGHLADQLLMAQADVARIDDFQAHVDKYRDAVMSSLISKPAFLSHTHAIALEMQLIETQQERCATDPVLSPLLKALIGSSDPETAATAMHALTAQARFVQNQRRMELPLGELSGDLFHSALMSLRAHTSDMGKDIVYDTETALRAKFDEASGREGLLSRLVMDMGPGVLAALALDHAGASIFLTALSITSGQSRELALFSTTERQIQRLALALRAAGLPPKRIEGQLLLLHPDVAVPELVEYLSVERARALLSGEQPWEAKS